MAINNDAVVLFDGVCNLCNTGVNFIIEHDRNNYFKFASLQSEFAGKVLRKFNKTEEKLRSIILLEKGKIYFKSTAVLRITRKLNGAWKLLYGLILIPPFVRNFLYDIIAGSRYNWFGKMDTCRIPAPGEKSKFII